MRVLITGVAGFIGSHLCHRLLEEGHVVFGVDNLSVGFISNMVDFIGHRNFHYQTLDIVTDVKPICRHIETIFDDTIDVVFHLAARGETYWCQDNPTQAVDVNVNGTLNVLDIAEKYRCIHFIFADTSAEYDSIPYRETEIVSNYPSSRSFSVYDPTYPSKEYQAPTIKTPMGIYSITKMCASQFVRSKTSDKTFGTTLVRPFNVYGPSMNLERDIPPVIGSFIKNILDDKPCVIFGDGSKQRDFIYIDDAIELLFQIMKRRTGMFDTQTFNMGYGVSHSINDICKIVCKEMGVTPNINFKPDKEYEAKITLSDITKAKKSFDWNPQVDITTGIRKTIKEIKKGWK